MLKVIISATIIAASSELAKRSSVAAAILISIPITSILALIWVYHDTQNTSVASQLSMSIFWLVLPSLCFFVFLSKLLDHGISFWPSMGGACCLTALVYGGYAYALGKVGISL